MQYTLQVLTVSGSKVLKQWKETDRKITFCYNEAKDNSKFIQSIETCCHSLYLDDPVIQMDKHFLLLDGKSIRFLIAFIRLPLNFSIYFCSGEHEGFDFEPTTNGSLNLQRIAILQHIRAYLGAYGEDYQPNDRDVQGIHHL